MRVVVTGATSMIGTALIKECIRNHDEVLAIVRAGTPRLDRLPDSPNISICYAELSSLDSIDGDGREYDVFYHLAWTHTTRDDRDDVNAALENVQCTLDAVRLAHRLGCRRFVGAGSQAEFGICHERMTAETVPNPVTAYGIAKHAADLFSKKLCDQLGITQIWVRILSVYGIHDNRNTLISYALRSFENQETAAFSSCRQTWNYLYEDDAGVMLHRLGVNTVEGGHYLIANDVSRPLREYVEDIISFYPGAHYEFAREDASQVVSLDADISKTIHVTGYAPQISFHDGISRIVQSIKENPA